MRTLNFIDPSLIDKDDVRIAGYHVYDIYTNRWDRPVVIQMSESADPPHWYIQDGTNSIFFLSLADVNDYIYRRGLVLGKKYKSN